MRYTAYVNILPRTEILDPQGKATQNGLHNLGFSEVSQVRVGKRIVLQLEAETPQSALATAQRAAEKLLANPIVEQFSVELAPSS